MPNSPRKDRPRVQFVCDLWVKEFLDQWATAENRSTSNLIETIVLDAVQAKGELPKPPQPPKQRKTKEDK
jgi:hypothetical protein